MAVAFVNIKYDEIVVRNVMGVVFVSIKNNDIIVRNALLLPVEFVKRCVQKHISKDI